MGYQLTDFKWGAAAAGSRSGAISVSADLSGLNYNARKYTEDDFIEALNKAMNSWEVVAGVDFKGGGTDIEIGVDALPGSAVGSASIWYSHRSGMDKISSVDIAFDKGEKWTPYGEAGGLDFYAVALHEVGHAIGLGHIHDNTQIMNPVISSHKMGKGDAAGARAIYGRDGGDRYLPPSVAKIDGETPLEDPDNNTSAPKQSDGGGNDDDGGLLGKVMGAMAAVLALFFGGGVALLGAALFATRPEDDTPEVGTEYLKAVEANGGGVSLDDIFPDYEEDLHNVTHHSFLSDCGCDGGCSCAMDHDHLCA